MNISVIEYVVRPLMGRPSYRSISAVVGAKCNPIPSKCTTRDVLLTFIRMLSWIWRRDRLSNGGDAMKDMDMYFVRKHAATHFYTLISFQTSLQERKHEFLKGSDTQLPQQFSQAVTGWMHASQRSQTNLKTNVPIKVVRR